MAIDLEAVRHRVAQLNGERLPNAKAGDIKLWKPEVGTYKIRGLPDKRALDGMPIREPWVYCLGDERAFLSPDQFGQPDPVAQLRIKLFKTGKAEDKELAKQLMSKNRPVLPIIVRGEEDKGVQFWFLPKNCYKKFLGMYMDEETPDVLDVNEGYDLKVTVSHTPGKTFRGKPSLDYDVETAKKPSVLADSEDEVEKLLNNIPDIMNYFTTKTKDEIDEIVTRWFS